MEIRKPRFAGSFYEDNASSLRNQIHSCFTGEFGPGPIDAGRKTGALKGIIVPHAGYAYSGMCAAHGYRRLAESNKHDSLIILGFSHHGRDRSVTTSMRDWETPLGLARADKGLIEHFIAETDITIAEEVHTNEHSIEVQLPFLQYIYKDPLMIVPLSVSNNADFKRVAEQMNKVLSRLAKKAFFIASSDFLHYGKRFGYVPFREDIQKRIAEIDHGAIERIKALDTKGFMRYIVNTDATICGAGPIALLLELLKDDVNRVELLKYYTSAELSGDQETSVSYACIAFENIQL